VSLTRRRDTRDYTIREVPPGEAGPILQRYVRLAPSARAHFQAAKDSPVEAFAAEADRHPVFELTPAGADRQPGHPGHDRATVALSRHQVVAKRSRPTKTARAKIRRYA
jgi:hypothetical protein